MRFKAAGRYVGRAAGRVVRPVALGVLFLTALPPYRLAAFQCPDGTPPPCPTATRAPARAAAPAPDPASRIVVLPFRVTTADTLLGEGVAELLSAEFTGEGGPRAVHMGSVIRAWRQAGGGARLPLQQAVADRTTRQLGASRYVDGSIVGLGNRLTVTASVVEVDGTVRRTSPIAGPIDSLPALLQRLSAALLAASGTRRSGPAMRLSDSPAAIRLYMEGLANFRRGEFIRAARLFEDAFAADDQFARAAYMRWLTTGWGPGFGTSLVTLWRDRTRALRDHLSAQDQLVLEAALGNLATKERIAAAMPESPEVWYYVGDNYYHNARARGWTDAIARAREAFERSIAIDSQATTLQHMVEIGLWTSDTALLREVWPAYDRISAGGNPAMGIVVAARLGDARLLETMRRRFAAAGHEYDFTVVAYGPMTGLPGAHVEEAYTVSRGRLPPAEREVYRGYTVAALTGMGRPSAAARIAAEGPAGDTALSRGFNADVLQMVAAALGDGDRALGEAARTRLLAARQSDSADLAVTRCGLRLWDALVRDSIVTGDPLLEARQRACAVALRMLADRRAGTLDSARLAYLDSIAAGNPVLWGYSGVGPWLSGTAWEALGVRSRALARMRGGSVGFPDHMMAARRRAEARLAAASGDTTGAIRAYREYLDLRRDAEPVLIPQRDSVQVELDRLLMLRRPVP